MLRFFPNVRSNTSDQILNRHAPSKDFRALQCTACQERLERLNETAFRVGADISFDSFGSGPGLDNSLIALSLLLEVQQRTIRIGKSGAMSKSDQLNVPEESARATELLVVPKSMPIVVPLIASGRV